MQSLGDIAKQRCLRLRARRGKPLLGLPSAELREPFSCWLCSSTRRGQTPSRRVSPPLRRSCQRWRQRMAARFTPTQPTVVSPWRWIRASSRPMPTRDTTGGRARAIGRYVRVPLALSDRQCVAELRRAIPAEKISARRGEDRGRALVPYRRTARGICA